MTDLLEKVEKAITTTYKYKGSFEEFPENHDSGDVILVNGKTYVWTGDAWDCIGEADSTQEPEVDTSEDFQPILCKQCGAPLNPRKDRCDFCHTWYHNSRLHQEYSW